MKVCALITFVAVPSSKVGTNFGVIEVALFALVAISCQEILA